MIGMAKRFDESPYARCISASKRVRWDIDEDVIRGRKLDFKRAFLPDGLSGVSRLDFLGPDERRLASQVQGRTYAWMFGLVERYINAQVIELQAAHSLGDQVALEALVRFSDEELKHQALFRRVEEMTAEGLPPGHRFVADPDEVARVVLDKSTWSILGLTLVIELFTQAHYRSSLERDAEICPVFKDVFLHHWKEESQHAVLDELEWRRVDALLDEAQRSAAVGDLIDLVVAVDGILTAQAEVDADYFIDASGHAYDDDSRSAIHQLFVDAYRWQYILSGTSLSRFQDVLGSLVSAEEMGTIVAALGGLAPSTDTEFAPLAAA